MNVNVLHVYYLFKIMAEQLMKREKRSSMIVTSSMAFVRPTPFSIAYSAHKRFVTFLAQGMFLEMSSKIDIMSFNPGEVATKLINRD
jgi:short-subunit dehydrogenase